MFAVHLLNTQLISVFNFILTVGGSFAFAYKATEYAMETPNYVLVCCILRLLNLTLFLQIYHSSKVCLISIFCHIQWAQSDGT